MFNAGMSYDGMYWLLLETMKCLLLMFRKELLYLLIIVSYTTDLPAAHKAFPLSVSRVGYSEILLDHKH